MDAVLFALEGFSVTVGEALAAAESSLGKTAADGDVDILASMHPILTRIC